MKKFFVIIFCISIQSSIFSQAIEDIDSVFPFNENLAAIKKGDKWGFINREGVQVIDFRNDIVSTKVDDSNYYPIFVDGKCLIKKEKEGVYYYGYIDVNDTTVIEPQYINGTNFNNGYAIVIEVRKDVVGKNVLGKEIVLSKLEEYIIDASGKIIKSLDNSRGYVPSKQSPSIESEIIAPNLVKIKKENKKWTIAKF